MVHRKGKATALLLEECNISLDLQLPKRRSQAVMDVSELAWQPCAVASYARKGVNAAPSVASVAPTVSKSFYPTQI